MSTATQQQQTARINAAVTELKKHLASKGVVMENTHANAQHLLDVVKELGLDSGNSNDLMTAFTRALSKQVLRFEKGFEPAVLRQKNAPLQGTLTAVAQAQKDADARAVARKNQEEVDAEAKRESVAQAATTEAITSFLLTRGGSVRYAPTQDFQKLLQQNVDKFRRDGMKWQAIFPVIKTWIADKYTEWERDGSKSTGGGLR